MGFNTATLGWNLGLVWRARLDHRLRPYGMLIYGYNMAVRYEGATGNYVGGENYYGPSVGAGIEWWVPGKTNFLHIGLIVPIRSAELNARIQQLDRKPWPVLPTIGVHF
jgi:hypothetical protein